MSDAAIVVEDVSKRFRMYKERNQSLKAALLRGGRSTYEEFWALQDVSFEVPEGSTFGLIGENGSGKSTLLKCIARILEPDRGRIRCSRRIAALLELGSGFHPELSGRENVYLNGSILGLSKGQLDARFDEIVDFSGIEHFIDQPVKNYSSGMYVRLGFAVAINVDPEVLLVDEVLAVGDAAFQRKCEERFAQFRRSGRTVVLVSHAMGSLREMCDNVAWLEHGRVTSVGSPHQLVDQYIENSFEVKHTEAGADPRSGSGEIVVDRAEILDAQGHPLDQPRSGEAVRFRLHYTARAQVREPIFSFAIEAVDGARLWAHNSRDGDAVPSTLGPGSGYVDLHVPALRLQPGVFDFSASVFRQDHGAYFAFDRRLRMLQFAVRRGAARESGGPLSLAGAWDEPVMTAGAGGGARPGEPDVVPEPS